MFLNVWKQTFYISHMRISRISLKRCFNVKSSTNYFRKKTKILADFKVCIIVPLIYKMKTITLWHKYLFYQIDFGIECAPNRWVFHFGKDLKTFNLLNLLKLAKCKLPMYLWGGIAWTTFNCFTASKSNRVKISVKIKRWQG